MKQKHIDAGRPVAPFAAFAQRTQTRQDADAVVSSLAALAQATRLALFRLLVQAGPAGLPAGAAARNLGVAAPTLSFHLKELVHAGLIHAKPQGRFVVYCADYDAMNALIAYLTDNCCRLAGSCEFDGSPDCAPKPKPRRRDGSRRPATASDRRRAP